MKNIYFDISISNRDLYLKKLVLSPSEIWRDDWLSTIHWTKAVVIDGESDQPTRWIKEAVHIRKEGQQAMNWDKAVINSVMPMTAFLTR